MPSVLTLLSLRPNCGRASAATNNASVAPRNTSNSDGPSADQSDDNDRAGATEENLSPPRWAERRSHHSHAGNTNSKCVWCPDMFGVNSNAAGQAWYDSCARLWAGWGVDYIKVDDLSEPYHLAEVEMVCKAILQQCHHAKSLSV